MRSLPIFIALALFATLAFADVNRDFEPIVYLTAKNFHNAVQSNENMLISFYGAYDPYSQKFAPVYQELAQRLAKKLPNVKVAGVDVYENYDLAEKLGVQNTPTVMLFTKNGSVGVTFKEEAKDVNTLFKWITNEMEKSQHQILLQKKSKVDRMRRLRSKRHGRHHTRLGHFGH